MLLFPLHTDNCDFHICFHSSYSSQTFISSLFISLKRNSFLLDTKSSFFICLDLGFWLMPDCWFCFILCCNFYFLVLCWSSTNQTRDFKIATTDPRHHSLQNSIHQRYSDNKPSWCTYTGALCPVSVGVQVVALVRSPSAVRPSYQGWRREREKMKPGSVAHTWIALTVCRTLVSKYYCLLPYKRCPSLLLLDTNPAEKSKSREYELHYSY